MRVQLIVFVLLIVAVLAFGVWLAHRIQRRRHLSVPRAAANAGVPPT